MGASATRPIANRLLIFIGERFPPLAYGPLILAFVACGSVAAARERPLSLAALVAAAFVVTLAFLRMRLLDEVKDLEIDRLGRPWRPLPRGLVTVAELRLGARVALVAMAVTALLLGPAASVAFLLVAAFHLWAGEDFFAGPRLRRRPLLYALAHSPAVPLLLLFAWAAQPGALVEPALGWLLVLTWAAALGMEIGRKTLAPAEERPFVETYSKLLGRSRSALLAASCLALAALAGAGYASAIGLPGWLSWTWLAGGAFILASWLVIRRATGRVIEAWAGLTTLLLLLLPTTGTTWASLVR